MSRDPFDAPVNYAYVNEIDRDRCPVCRFILSHPVPVAIYYGYGAWRVSDANISHLKQE